MTEGSGQGTRKPRAGSWYILRGGTPDALGPRTLRPLSDLEFDAVTLSEIVDAFAIDRALVEKVVVPRRVLDKAEPLVRSQCPNRSCHLVRLLASSSPTSRTFWAGTSLPILNHSGDEREVRL